MRILQETPLGRWVLPLNAISSLIFCRHDQKSLHSNLFAFIRFLLVIFFMVYAIKAWQDRGVFSLFFCPQQPPCNVYARKNMCRAEKPWHWTWYCTMKIMKLLIYIYICMYIVYIFMWSAGRIEGYMIMYMWRMVRLRGIRMIVDECGL